MQAFSLQKLWLPALIAVTLLGAVGAGLGLVQRPATQEPLPQVEFDCGLPGDLEIGLYGTVLPERLPWAHAVPEKLTALQSEHGATQLVAAFRTTLPSPLFNEAENVMLAASYLAGTVLPPQGRFSLNPTIGPCTVERGYSDGPMYSGGKVVRSLGGGVCKIATTVYNAATLAGMTILERHPHSMQVPYVPPGRDAAVAWGYKNLRFSNPYDKPVVIWSEMDELTLYIAFYGDHVPPQVEWHHEELAREPMPLIRRSSNKLDPGEEDVIVEGFDGVTVKTWLILRDPDGTEHRRDLGVDYYRPMPRVVEFGPRP